MEQGLRLLASRQLLSCMLGVMLCCQFALSRNQQTCYGPIARLVVRLEGKLSSLGRAHPIFSSAISPGLAPQKSGGHIKKFVRRFSRAFCARPLSNCFRRHWSALCLCTTQGRHTVPCTTLSGVTAAAQYKSW